MTTCIVDIKHNVVVTDGRLTNKTISGKRPFWMLRVLTFQNIWNYNTDYKDNYFNKFYRIPSSNGQTVFSCACGNVSEITTFLDRFQKNKLPRKYLENSTVLLMKYFGEELRIYRAQNSKIERYENVDWIIMGSGKDIATGAFLSVSEENKNRAVKAIQIASQYDEGTSFNTKVYHLEEFDDIY